jgi:hypothetical protein
MSDAMYDVRREQYAAVIRDMIRHEDDVINHRVMWLLIGQGFIANAFVVAKNEKNVSETTNVMLSVAGILVTLSAFVMLYKSYQARGYLNFLGRQAKQGKLQEEYLPLVGWPEKRIKNWWRDIWLCPWIQQTGDVLEPWLFLPCFFMCIWLIVLLYQTGLELAVVFILAAILTAVILSVFCIIFVWSQGKDYEA